MSRESSDGEDVAEIVKAVNGKASLRSEVEEFCVSLAESA